VAYPRLLIHHTRSRPGAGLARALSKMGICSRSQASELIQAGRVRVNGVETHDPDYPVTPGRDRVDVDGPTTQFSAKVYLMLNKPRGVVTTRSDEHGRDTVFRCLEGADLPFLSAIGRLDKASEGLLLFTNDTAWGARITDPDARIKKVYHVQISCMGDESLLQRIVSGVKEGGEFLSARRASILRHGSRKSWVEIILDEGRNRHIRRLMAALGIEVVRLVRVAVGSLALGTLPKGQWRHLTRKEVESFAQVVRAP
jgi:23S rRNA pseudouridine2605 synthase